MIFDLFLFTIIICFHEFFFKDDDDESWDNESLSQPTSGHDESSSEAETDPNSDVEISQLFVPSVPERPRILSTSSSSSSSSSSIPELGPR